MEESVIDRAVYAELRETTDAEFVVELVDTFIEERPGMLAELRAARAEGNAERFRRAAHSLKSNGRTFGALKLTALAREFELKGLGTDPTRDSADLAALEAEYARAAAELKALCPITHIRTPTFPTV
jgi:HPt (histidine-containing phosphotransfer) domain-containing protein